MLRRLAHAALIGGFFLYAARGAIAVEFVVSDKSLPKAATGKSPGKGASSARSTKRAKPAPTFQDPVSILDELPDNPIPPAPRLTPTPSEHFASPLEADPAFGADSMPESLPETDLPTNVNPLHSSGTSTMADENLFDSEWNDAEFMDGSNGDCLVGPCDDGSWGSAVGARGCSRKCCGWYMDLWIAQGYNWNPDDPTNGSNLPVTYIDRANEYLMNQLYVSLGRKVCESGDSWDMGGRVDLLYGTDYFFTTALGLETETDGTPRWNSSDGPRGTGAALYGLAMPQVYAEVFAPILCGVNFKVGHFYTPMGYESAMAPENFFYSHSYALQYGLPLTHTGAMASFGVAPAVTGHAAVTRGWNTWEDPNNDWGYLFGFSWEPTDVASLAAMVHQSREDAAGEQGRTIYSLVYTRQLTCRLRYVLQHDFGMEANAEFDGNFNRDSAKWYGVNQYLYMDINCRLTAGMRFEWFRDQDNARVLGLPFESLVSGGNYVAMTYGLNWMATDHMTVRPELRYDWSDVDQSGIAGDGMFNDFTDDNQFTAAMDIIFQF